MRVYMFLILLAVCFLADAQGTGKSDLSNLSDGSDNYGVKVTKINTGTVYTTTETDPAYKIDSARYTIFIPQGITAIRGVLVHQHGCTMEGRGTATAYDIQYQAFAKKWQLAIVGPDLYAKNNCHDWRHPESGSGVALLKALKEVGAHANLPSLGVAPWLLWGHSGGGYWVLAMLKAYPKRTMAVFAYSPAFESSPYPPAALKVPVMIRHAGQGDAPSWKTSIKEFGLFRSKGGYAAVAYTPHQSHNFSYVRYMAIPFFEAAMRQRVPSDIHAGYIKMKKMNAKGAWLGDTTSFNLYPAAEYPGNKQSAAWLPDSLTATLWREYAITGTVADHSAPPAPYRTKLIRRHNMTVNLYWSADADIESGISHFNIYKEGQLMARFPATGEYQSFDTNGDDAYPISLPPLQTELKLAANDSSKLYISTVNHFGLESVKTECQLIK